MHVSYVSRPLQGAETCYTPTEIAVLAMIHTARSVRMIFRKHKVKVTDRPIEEILRISGTEGRLVKWAAELRIFDVLYISRKEAKGQVVRKFPEEERQMPHALEENDKGESKNLRKEQARTPREWRLYMGRKASKEGSGIEMILISLDEKASSYTIRLNFHASEERMDYEALLAGLVASIGKCMKDLHVFFSSKELVDQVEGHIVHKTMETKRYKEEVMDVTTPFHRFRITHLPKNVNPKAENPNRTYNNQA
ncbi:reverse transcriptase domain-containing protein [Tanacetum coccineum]